MVARLVGGLTPADGSDPRTFPAIWNSTADDIEAVQSGLGAVESTVTALGGTVTSQGGIITANSTAIAGLETQLSELELDDLADVTIGTAVADGQVLAYSTAVSGWVNADGAVDGKILQVVSVVKSDTFSTSSSTLVNITGLAATITPQFTTSKIMCLLTIGIVDNDALALNYGDVTRGGTPIGIGNTGSTREVGWLHTTPAGNRGSSIAWSFLDNPESTSALTYQARVGTGNNTAYVNRQATDQNRGIATITLIEVAA
jgi:hypothetical protein